MKVTVNDGSVAPKVSTATMVPLKMYRISDKDHYDGEIVYRPHADFGLLICLSNLDMWWTWKDGDDKLAPTFDLEIVPEGVSITIAQCQ